MSYAELIRDFFLTIFFGKYEFSRQFFKVIFLFFEQLSERQTCHSFCQINA